MSTVLALLMVLLLGFVMGVYAYRYRIARGQIECAGHGLVYSPELHGGQDYCIQAAREPGE